jgi:hypothetical protein
MKYYSFFDELTGLFHPMSVKATSLGDAIASKPLGHSLIEGSFDHLCQRVDIEKANAARIAHEAAHTATVDGWRAAHDASRMSGNGTAFTALPMPEFLLRADAVIDYQPPQPSQEHEWNAETRRWVLSKAATDRQDAARCAKARLQALEIQERPLLRRLVLDPTNATARTSLAAIDAEIAELEKLSAE